MQLFNPFCPIKHSISSFGFLIQKKLTILILNRLPVFFNKSHFNGKSYLYFRLTKDSKIKIQPDYAKTGKTAQFST